MDGKADREKVAMAVSESEQEAGADEGPFRLSDIKNLSYAFWLLVG